MSLTKDLLRPIWYRQAIADKKAAFEAYQAASARYEVAIVNERCAELASQSFESIAGGKLHQRLGTITDHEREIGIAFARYAITGRADET